MPRKIYLFAGGHKIAEGKGLVLPSDKPGAINSKPWGDANAAPLQQLHQQYLDQHPGMLTYDDAPSNPAGHHKDLYAGSELVLDKNQQQRLANILNLKEK